MTGAVPAGCLPRAVRLLRAAATLLDRLDGFDGPAGASGRAGAGAAGWAVDEELVEAHLLLPHVVAAANHLAPPSPPPAPLAAPGGGFVAVDLGPDDHDAWHTLQSVLAAEQAGGAAPPDAEELARRAQEWRLAVTPYRSVSHPGPGGADRDVLLDVAALVAVPAPRPGTAAVARTGAGTTADGHRSDTAPLHGVRIVDLTAMWAGPLATWLAAGLGAEVTKVEAACRRDGLRRSARPAAAGPGDGALFVALDGGKAHLELDLREPADRGRFDALVAGADVVIDSFSRRVRPNLGIDHDRLAARRPALIDLSLTAFPPDGPEADWVAYGGGVHATSGLGRAFGPAPGGPVADHPADHPADDRPVPALLPYPDPLAGFEAFVTLLAALLERQRGAPGPWRRTLSLADAVTPLTRVPTVEVPGTPDRAGGGTGRSIVERAAELAHRTIERDGCRVVPPPLYRESRP